MQTYLEYLSEIEFEGVQSHNEITEQKLIDLPRKEGFVIESGRFPMYICRKFEPMTILNTATVFEKLDTYYIIDPFGVINWESDAKGCLEYLDGFYSDEESEMREVK